MKNPITFEVEGQTHYMNLEEAKFLREWMKEREIALKEHLYNFNKQYGITKENESETNSLSKSK